jgi:hypothetical protein
MIGEPKKLEDIKREFENLSTNKPLFQNEVLDRCEVIKYVPKTKQNKNPTVILKRDDGIEIEIRWDSLKKGTVPKTFISTSDRLKKTLFEAQQDFANIIPKTEEFGREILERCKVVEYLPRRKEYGKSFLPQFVLERDDGLRATVFVNNLKKGMFPEAFLSKKEVALKDVQQEFGNLKTDKALFQREVLDRCEIINYIPGTKTKQPKIILKRDDGLECDALWNEIKKGRIPEKFRPRSSWNIKSLKDVQKEFRNISCDNPLFKEKVLDACKVVKYIPYSNKNGKITEPRIILKRNDGLECDALWNEIKRGRIPWVLLPKEKTLAEVKEEFASIKPRSEEFKREVLDRCEVVDYVPFTKENETIKSARVILRRDDGVEASLIWNNFKTRQCIPSVFGFSKPLTNNEPGILYHIICKKHSIICQKIGVTRYDVKKRYENGEIDIVKIVSETSYDSGLFDQENIMKQQMKEKYGNPIFGNEYFSLMPVL